MGYKIIYGPEFERPSPQPSDTSRIRILTALFLLLFCASIRFLWPEGTAVLKSLLLPGTLTATEQALLTMMEELRLGESLGASITTFCKTVLANGTPLVP